jgi:hypothetical protein
MIRLPIGRPRVFVYGSEPLCSRVVAELSAAGREVRLITPDQLARSRPGAVRTLILADPPAPADLIAAFLARCGHSRARLILMHRKDPPPPLREPDPSVRVRLETFAVENRAARALLARWPLHAGMDPPFGQGLHLLIAGFAAPAEAFLVQALRLIQYGEERPTVSILSDDPASLSAGFHAAYPQAAQVAELRFAPLASPASALEGIPPVTLGLVSLGDPDGTVLGTVRTLVRTIAEVQGVSPPILLEIGDSEPSGDVGDWDGQLVPISHVREACRPGVLLDGIGDEVALSIHEHYCDSIAAQGRDPSAEAAGQPWSKLAASYRQANRHQADHLWAKLAVTDCRAVSEEMVESFAFTPLEVERLAIIEHRRWAADRYLDGWSYAPVRDNARRHHPQLIPYAELSEPMKDLDRFAVRGVPTLLARSGLGVVRMLIVGIPEPSPGADLGSRQDDLAVPLLERLRTRFPDRALIFATTLRDPGVRALVRLALEQAGAGLFWLLPRPVGELLAAQPDAGARRDLLALAALAERRIGLRDEGELARWLAERAEIALVLGDPEPALGPAKRVRVCGGARVLDWNFEY